MDERDNKTWVVLELSYAGEKHVNDGSLPQVLREALSVGRDFPVFIPSTFYNRGGKKTAVHLMEGYAFVSTGLNETDYFSLENGPYVHQVLSIDSKSGMRTLSTLPDSEIKKLTHKLKDHVANDLEEGMWVEITDGRFGNLEGRVVHIEGEDATVYIELRSMKVLTHLPKIFLAPKKEDEN